MEPIPTLAAWYDEWEATRRHQLEASSLRSYRWMADSYLLPHLGEHPLDELTVRTVEAAYARLLTAGGRRGQPLAPRTVAYAHAVLHRCLVDAVRLGVLTANPVADVVLPTYAANGAAPRRVQVWDAAQVRHFLVATADHPLADVWRRLVPTLDLPPIRLYDLRHTHATLLLTAGLPVRVVAERLGHVKVAMTLDLYAHVLPAMDRDAADRLSELLHPY